MMNDEKTTEIEIPTTKTGNIVRVNFSTATAQGREVRNPKPALPGNAPAAVHAFPPRDTSHQWFRDFEIENPWVIRLLAVLGILLLSLLII